jgi:hypothetical protein
MTVYDKFYAVKNKSANIGLFFQISNTVDKIPYSSLYLHCPGGDE